MVNIFTVFRCFFTMILSLFTVSYDECIGTGSGTSGLVATPAPVTSSSSTAPVTPSPVTSSSAAPVTVTPSIDSCGNDVMDPTAVCKGNYQVSIVVYGFTDTFPNAQEFDGGSNDNCGKINQFDMSPKSFACSNMGPNVVTLTVIHLAGNSAECTTLATVMDGGTCDKEHTSSDVD